MCNALIDMILDINECQVSSPCSSDASCADTPGSFTCTCNTGFIGDGFTCAGELLFCFIVRCNRYNQFVYNLCLNVV